MMKSTKRIGIVLLSSVIFIIIALFLGTSLGFPFSQTKTLLTFVGLALTFSVSTEQILRWTRNEQASNTSTTEDIPSTETTESETEENIFDSTSSSSEQSLYSSYLDDAEWQKYKDEGYKSTRALSTFANQIGSFVYRVPHLTKRRVWTAIAFVMFLGFACSIIAFSELMVQSGFKTQLWRDVATTFSIEMIESSPMLAFMFSLFASLIPLRYLALKQQMSCGDCGTEFSLNSLGRFYNKNWGKESVPIFDEGGNQVDDYHEYEGYRILECETCGQQHEEATKWDDRDENV